MDVNELRNYSLRLKDIAKDLSFLGQPRFPLKSLHQLFPQHHGFISLLEDTSVPFPVDVDGKKRAIDLFMNDLAKSDLSLLIKRVFTQRIQDYHTLLSMMENFDTVFFYECSVKLYGSSHKMNKNNAFLYFLEQMPNFTVPDTGVKGYEASAGMDFLRGKLCEVFDPGDFEVKASTSLLSDSSSGRKSIKLNPTKNYSQKQLEVFLVHEGWVHLGTSLNGAAQTDHLWLGTWAPRTTFLQEGLALLTEIITGCLTPERWNRVVLRHLATSMAEKGSPITDVYAYLRHHEMEDIDAFKLALRVFRGVPLEGGMAFTKELLYLHGMIELLYHLHFFKADLKSLWAGKMSFEEHLIMLDSQLVFRPQIKYFPKGLETSEVEERLKKLKELSFSLFHQGFL
jgi:uncharacterized protein (TIGR02421 family)